MRRKRKEITKRLVSFGVIIMLLACSAPQLGEAIDTNCSCPYLVMDYVPRQSDIHDTASERITQDECRGCHGNSLAERHHATPLVVKEYQCSACHAMVPGAGLAVTRDCTTSGCHSRQDVYATSWHNSSEYTQEALFTPNPPKPVIDTSVQGIQPSAGRCGALVSLWGMHFGKDHREDSHVEIENNTGEWLSVPVHTWTDTHIEFEVPCWDHVLPGHSKENFPVRVVTPAGESNTRIFTLENRLSSLDMNPDSGPSGTWIKISLDDPETGSFGSSRTQIFDDGYHGVCRIVDFISSQGTFTALAYRNWSPSSFEVKSSIVFKDSIDPLTGIRNYVRDARNESTITRDLASGQWAVFVRSIYFGDSDHTAGLSSGDIIFQVSCSDSLLFELSVKPVIYSITPIRISNNNLVKVIGTGFGTLQGSSRIRIGSEGDAKNPALGLGEPQDAVLSWSSTAIKIRVSVPPEWSGKVKCLWMEKGKEKSNYQRVKIL